MNNEEQVINPQDAGTLDPQPSNLQQAIQEMRNMREAYDQLAQSAEAYNEGKPALATAITAKGVATQPTDSLAKMAQNVMAISQDSYTIDGGEMYAKQLFGALEAPNYWNLYDILAQLLSDGRLVNYGGILLAEYYRGYDSLALSGAGAGGAYVVSDKDGDGNFIMYTSDTTHTWATEFDGKGNRWVAYCFADEYHDFQITDTNTSPRSIFIGRKVGTITNLVNGRASQIVVPDGNELKCVDANGKTQNFGQCVVLRNIKEQTKTAIQLTSNIDGVYLEADTLGISSSMTQLLSKTSNTIKSIIVKAREIKGYVILNTSTGSGSTQTEIASVHIDGVESCKGSIGFFSDGNGVPFYVDAHYDKLKEIVITNTEQLTLRFYCAGSAVFPNTTIFFGYKTNDRSKAVSIINSYLTLQVKDVQLQENWCKPLNVSDCPMLTEANMYAHILQRLKQDEPDCGDGITITLGSTNLAKLTSAESVALLAELRGTYGYTFA